MINWKLGFIENYKLKIVLMILYIDSTDFNAVTYQVDGEKPLKKVYKVDPHESHQVLKNLENFFKQSKIMSHTSEISQIVVNKGPGSYTGTRIGVTHALALGFAWQVPVRAVAEDQFKKMIEKNKPR